MSFCFGSRTTEKVRSHPGSHVTCKGGHEPADCGWLSTSPLSQPAPKPVRSSAPRGKHPGVLGGRVPSRLLLGSREKPQSEKPGPARRPPVALSVAILTCSCLGPKLPHEYTSALPDFHGGARRRQRRALHFCSPVPSFYEAKGQVSLLLTGAKWTRIDGPFYLMLLSGPGLFIS